MKTPRLFVALAVACAASTLTAQSRQQTAPRDPRLVLPAAPSPSGGRGPAQVQTLGPNRLRIGAVDINTATREISVAARTNSATILEFVANTLGGFKAYESALTVQTDAITFNTALILIGLDQKRARTPRFHFDPEPPKGDPVDVWVDWNAGGTPRRIRVEQLLLDKRTNTTMEEGPWVYTGSSFAPNGGPYLAESDGVLIGFVHSPAPIIENPRRGAVDAYGSVVFNDRLGLKPETPVTLVVRAIGTSK